MKLSYLKNGETLVLDPTKCNGCRECIEVCPHAVFAMSAANPPSAVHGNPPSAVPGNPPSAMPGNPPSAVRKSQIVDRGACMECGACARNCASGAITVKAGVGCAAAIIGGMLRGTQPTCGSCGPAATGSSAGCC